MSDYFAFDKGFIVGLLVGMLIIGIVAWILLIPTMTTYSGQVNYVSTSNGSTTLIINGQAFTCSLTTSTNPSSIVAIGEGDYVTIQHNTIDGACTVLSDIHYPPTCGCPVILPSNKTVPPCYCYPGGPVIGSTGSNNTTTKTSTISVH